MIQKCHECGGPLRAAKRERTRHVGAYAFTAKLPALVCKCGEALYESRDVEAFDLRVATMLARAGVTEPAALRFLRKALGYQAQELAGLLGVRPETISRWETGKGKIDRAAYAVLRHLVFDETEGGTSMADNLRSLLRPKPLKATNILRSVG